MKIIHTSDWHIGKILNKYSMLENQKDIFEKFISKMQEIKPDIIIIAGDIYDRSIPSAEAVSLLNSILSKLVLELKIKVIIIAGNHDSKERLAFGNEFLEQCGLYIVSDFILNEEDVVKKISFEDDFGKINFYAVPFYDIYDIKECFREIYIKNINHATELISQNIKNKLNFDERNILIAHGFFSNISIDNRDDDFFMKNQVGTSENMSLRYFDYFDYIALGHIHDKINTGCENAKYSGSILKNSLNEVGNINGFYILDFKEKSKLSISFEELKPFRDVYYIEDSFNNLMSIDERNEDFVFANITDKEIVIEAMQQLKTLYPNILGLKFINNNFMQNIKHETLNDIKNKSTTELFEDFFLQMTGEKLTHEEKNIILDVQKLI